MDWFTVFSWNVRGLASTQHRANVKNFIQKFKPVVVCLQESMCNLLDDRYKGSMGVYDSASWVEAPPVGLSGGLVTFWDSSLLKVDSHASGRHWILIKGSIIANNQKFSMFNIYAPQALQAKVELWDFLSSSMQELTEELVCILGDFNCVR